MNFYERTDLACESYVLDDENNEKNGIIVKKKTLTEREEPICYT